jgi:cell division protein FtsB
MKNSILIALLISPLFSNAQTGGDIPGMLMVVAVVLGMVTLIFLALRQVLLWYWKVDQIVYNQQKANALMERNNKLLKEQVDLLRSQISVASVGSENKIDDGI